MGEVAPAGESRICLSASGPSGGGCSSYFISADGEKWTRLAHLPSVPAGGKIGLAAYSTSPEPSKVIFDQLKLAREKKQEGKKSEQ
jgi:hypothetical protein